MRHAVERVIYCRKGWGCNQAFIMIIRDFNSVSLWLVYCAGQLNTSSLVTGAFSRAHWWQGSAKKYPLNWALLRAGGRGRGVRSVKSRDRDCTILRYPALQNPTGLFTLHRIRWSEWLFLALSHHNTLGAALSNPWLFPYLCSLSWSYSCRLVPSLRSYLHCASLPLIRSLKQFPQESLAGIQKKSSRSAMNQILTNKLFVPFKNIGMLCILRFQFSDIVILGHIWAKLYNHSPFDDDLLKINQEHFTKAEFIFSFQPLHQILAEEGNYWSVMFGWSESSSSSEEEEEEEKIKRWLHLLQAEGEGAAM